MKIVNNSLNDGDTYTVNGTTYYKRGAQLTLRLKDNYTAAAITNGGDTLDLTADGTYSTTVSGVATITVSGISGRDSPMSTTQFTITGLTSGDYSVYVGENNQVYSDSEGTQSINWLEYDGSNGFTLTGVPTNLTLEPWVPITIEDSNSNECSLSIGDDALYGRGAEWALNGDTLTTTSKLAAGFYYYYTDDPSNPQVLLAKEADSESITITGLPTDKNLTVEDVKVDGYSIVLSQNAVNAIIANGGTVFNESYYFFRLADDVEIDGVSPATLHDVTREWTTNGPTLTYNDGKSGYLQTYDDENGHSELTISSAKKFSIDVTLPDGVSADANNWFTVAGSKVTINAAFFNAITSGTATIKLNNAGTNSYKLVYNGNVGDDLTLAAKSGSGNDYTFELSAYKEFTDNTFTYHAAQEFTISGLKSNLLSRDAITGVTYGLDGEKITVTLTNDALDNQNVTVNNQPPGYSVEFTLSGVDEAGETAASAAWKSNRLEFTASGVKAGYKVNGNMVRYSDTQSGNEVFTISGLRSDLSGYTFNVDSNGVITASNGTDTVNVGTVTKLETTEENGSVKTTFNVKLNDEALPDVNDLTNISISSEANVYFTLRGGDRFTMSKTVDATLNSESTPPP